MKLAWSWDQIGGNGDSENEQQSSYTIKVKDLLETVNKQVLGGGKGTCILPLIYSTR